MTKFVSSISYKEQRLEERLMDDLLNNSACDPELKIDLGITT